MSDCQHEWVSYATTCSNCGLNAKEYIADLERQLACWKHNCAKLEERLAPNVAFSVETDMPCEWRLEDQDFGLWETDCGGSWAFNEEGPLENECKYCPKCGRTMQLRAALEAGNE